MIRKIPFLFVSLSLLMTACGDDDGLNLAPPEERVAAAIQGLRDELVAPPNGWKVAYKPTNESGTFFILLDFDPDGTVNIQSDIPANDGKYRDQTITYRIDNSLGLELIFETYGVFQFLFELDDTTFGAEYEFLFVDKVDETLVFRSKTDNFDITTLIFEPANANDDNLFGLEIAQNLEAFSGIGLEDAPIRQQLILSDRNISIFWAIDIEKRNLNVEFAGIGVSPDEIIANQIIFIDHNTSYTLEGDLLILEEPFSFVLNGFRNDIEEVTIGQLENTGPSLCITGVDNNPIFTGQSPGLGNITVQNTIISSSGFGFTEDVYTVSSFFIFDDEGNSLADGVDMTGMIIENFPDVVGFAFLYGVELNDPTIPIYSLGFILDGGNLYFREFTPSSTDLNRVSVNLLDKYFYRTEPEGSPIPEGTEEALRAVTDSMFQGGEFYAYDFPLDGFEIFRLFNPCNGLDFLLVK